MSKYAVSWLEVGFGFPDSLYTVIVEGEDRPAVDAQLKDILLSQGLDKNTASLVIKSGAFTISDCSKVGYKI